MSEELMPLESRKATPSREVQNNAGTALQGFSIMREVEISKRVFHQRYEELDALIRERQILEEAQPYVVKGMRQAEFVRGIADGVKLGDQLGVEEFSEGSNLETTDWWLFIDYNTKAYARLNARISTIVREIADYNAKTQKAIKSELETLVIMGQMVRMESVYVLLSEYKLLATQYIPDNKKLEFSNKFEDVRLRFIQANPQIIGGRV